MDRMGLSTAGASIVEQFLKFVRQEQRAGHVIRWLLPTGEDLEVRILGEKERTAASADKALLDKYRLAFEAVRRQIETLPDCPRFMGVDVITRGTVLHILHAHNPEPGKAHELRREEDRAATDPCKAAWERYRQSSEAIRKKIAALPGYYGECAVSKKDVLWILRKHDLNGATTQPRREKIGQEW
jgi:hypothetical protein